MKCRVDFSVCEMHSPSLANFCDIESFSWYSILYPQGIVAALYTLSPQRIAAARYSQLSKQIQLDRLDFSSYKTQSLKLWKVVFYFWCQLSKILCLSSWLNTVNMPSASQATMPAWTLFRIAFKKFRSFWRIASTCWHLAISAFNCRSLWDVSVVCWQ